LVCRLSPGTRSLYIEVSFVPLVFFAAEIVTARVEPYRVCITCNKKGSSEVDGRTGEETFTCVPGHKADTRLSGFVRVDLQFGKCSN
jgi:hypothetical protein